MILSSLVQELYDLLDNERRTNFTHIKSQRMKRCGLYYYVVYVMKRFIDQGLQCRINEDVLADTDMSPKNIKFCFKTRTSVQANRAAELVNMLFIIFNKH